MLNKDLEWAQQQRDMQDPPTPRVVLKCDECGEDICEGGTYYHISDENICESCMKAAEEVAGW